MAQTKDNHISIANIFAVIGIVLLHVCIFLGYYYSGDNLGISILKASVWALAFVLLIWLIIKAKTADTDLTKWRIIEGVLVFVYIVVAVFSCPKVSRFVNIYTAADSLKVAATEDITLINDCINTFKQNERHDLTVTVTGLEVAQQGRASEALQAFVEENNFELTDVSISNFNEKWDDRIESIIDSTETCYAETWATALDECNNQIQGWSILKIPEAMNSMKTLSTQISAKLTEISATLPFPVIEQDESLVSDIIEQHEGKDYNISTTFTEKIENISSFSIIGIVLTIVLHLLVLFNYLIVPRTKKVRPKFDASYRDEGMTL